MAAKRKKNADESSGKMAAETRTAGKANKKEVMCARKAKATNDQCKDSHEEATKKSKCSSNATVQLTPLEPSDVAKVPTVSARSIQHYFEPKSSTKDPMAATASAHEAGSGSHAQGSLATLWPCELDTKAAADSANQAGSGGHTQRAAATLEACAMDPTAAADSAKQGSAQRSLATLGACAPDPTAAADSANQAGSGSHPQTLDPMAAAESANPAGSAGPVDFVEQLLEQIGAQPSSSVMDSFLPPGLVEDDQDRIAATMKADLSLLSLIYLYYGLFIFYLFFYIF